LGNNSEQVVVKLTAYQMGKILSNKKFVSWLENLTMVAIFAPALKEKRK